MLEDLSAHLLDIAMNSVAAGARRVQASIQEKPLGFLKLEVIDDGGGVDLSEAVATNPFRNTSRTSRRVGLGLSFLKQSAEQCGGSFHFLSEPGRGTRVSASFSLSHIDTPPLGDLPGACLILMIAAPSARWVFTLESETLDSEEISQALGGLEALRFPAVALRVKPLIARALSFPSRVWRKQSNFIADCAIA
ncbi:MAG: ATP-binding protein [Synergistaceae bacterium]|jgi:hypothetical protein|nr:ATP-binding protein [Synergistaceae bacterium]